MTVYKVLRKRSGHYQSYCAPFNWQRRYALNRTTTARANTGLLVFDSLESARAWLGTDRSIRPVYIFRGSGEGAVPLPYTKTWSQRDVTRVWAKPGPAYYTWPIGTLAVRSFTPFEKVEVLR